MFRFRLNARFRMSTIERVLLCGTAWMLAGACANAAAPPPARNPAKVTAVSTSQAAAQSNPEILLIEVYKELGANRLRSALAKADALVAAYPNFHLGHLIRGDLVLMHTRPVTTMGAVAGPQDKLRNLRAEAMVRLQSLRHRPDPALVPRAVLQLRDDQKHVLVVDAKRSRLYVYQNQKGELKLVTDYYVSQGKFGINKLKSGDQRTPLGVYYITSSLPGARLPDFYGPGALPINYPNEWDRLHGRSGSGIWLHGTPRDSYSRPPLSSDGCVVLTNPDLRKLIGIVDVLTPVVISDSVEFVNKTKWHYDRNLASSLIEGWRRDLESMNTDKLLANYSDRFKFARGDFLAKWIARHRSAYTGVRSMSILLRDTTLFLYPGRDDLLVGTFTEDRIVGKRKSTLRKRQYWTREGAQWKIISEVIL